MLAKGPSPSDQWSSRDIICGTPSNLRQMFKALDGTLVGWQNTLVLFDDIDQCLIRQGDEVCNNCKIFFFFLSRTSEDPIFSLIVGIATLQMKGLLKTLLGAGINLKMNVVIFSRAWSPGCQSLLEKLPGFFPRTSSKNKPVQHCLPLPAPDTRVMFVCSEVQCSVFTRLRTTACYVKAAEKLENFMRSSYLSPRV